MILNTSQHEEVTKKSIQKNSLLINIFSGNVFMHEANSFMAPVHANFVTANFRNKLIRLGKSTEWFKWIINLKNWISSCEDWPVSKMCQRISAIFKICEVNRFLFNISFLYSKKSPRGIKWELTRSGLIRSIHLEVFCEKSVLKNFAMFTGKHLYWSLFSNKVASL